jgi:hypothetical protein
VHLKKWLAEVSADFATGTITPASAASIGPRGDASLRESTMIVFVANMFFVLAPERMSEARQHRLRFQET